MQWLVLFFIAVITIGCSHAQGLSPADGDAIRIERFERPGPVTGVVAYVNLTDPRVQVRTALTDPRDPDGDGPCVGLLDTASGAARRLDWEVTMNASFFSVPKDAAANTAAFPYVMGHCGRPSGWLVVAGKTMASPSGKGLRSTVLIHRNGKVSLRDALETMPDDIAYAVSGNAMMLTKGAVTPPERDTARHPRSAVGLNEKGDQLLLVAVDGRQDKSRGVTLRELAEIFLSLGAHDAVNLDGGGSTAMVVRDPKSRAHGLVNAPSEEAQKRPFRVERPVIDVIGVALRP
jgi:Phosphodiester glycosidase